MSITYNNPDEVVKVKHILSLAEHIADKIDGSGSSSGSASKTAPTLTATVTNYSLASFESDNGEMIGSTCNLTYNGDGDIFIGKAPIDVGLRFKAFKNGASIAVKPFYLGSASTLTETVTFKVGFTETANYKACSVDITLTA